MQLQNEVKSNPKQPSYKKKYVAPKRPLCEIQGGSQEIAAMVG